MKIITQPLPDLFLLASDVFIDDRGFFLESYNKNKFDNLVEQKINFVQDNHSKSSYGVLRGLHYQLSKPQAKLVRVVSGSIFDVAVDIRKDSPTFGKWVGEVLSAENKKQFWIPEGFAHGFLSLEDNTHVLYKTNNFYYPEYDRSILWCDSQIGIIWPKLEIDYLISDKDSAAKTLAISEVF